MRKLSPMVRRIIALGVSTVIVVVLASFVPWHEVTPYLKRLTPGVIVALLGLSVMFYMGRIIRYWLMLQMLGQHTKFRIVALACLVAQPIAVLPGGELYRGLMLKRYGNVSLRDGTASVMAQSLAESLGLITITFIGSLILHRYVILSSILAALFLAIIISIQLYNGQKAHRFPNLLPGIKLHHMSVRGYLNRNKMLLTGWNFVTLLSASLITTGAGMIMLDVISHALGHPLSLSQSAIVYALPAVLEIVTFLPGGLGANEGSSTALLLLFNIALPVAIAITIIFRLASLGMGFVYGFMAIVWARIGKFERFD